MSYENFFQQIMHTPIASGCMALFKGAFLPSLVHLSCKISRTKCEQKYQHFSMLASTRGLKRLAVAVVCLLFLVCAQTRNLRGKVGNDALLRVKQQRRTV
jgi:hypothetical protein